MGICTGSKRDVVGELLPLDDDFLDDDDFDDDDVMEEEEEEEGLWVDRKLRSGRELWE